MNKIASFGLCKLSDEELLKKVDEGTDNIYKEGKIPTRHIPARPDSDYDLLVGELLLRFKERMTPASHPSPSAPVVAEQERAEAERILKSKLDGKIMVANSPDFTFNKVIEAMVEFKHSPAERIEGDAVDCVYEIDFGGNLKCRMKIVGNKINVEAAMNGWGDGISIDEIKITELKTTQASGIDFVKRYTELRKEFNMVDALRKLQIESSSPPQEPSSKADEMERLKNKLADDFRKNYTLDLNAEGAAEEGFKAGWDKLLVLLQNQPSAKAIAEAAFTAGELYGSDKVNVLKPGGEIYPKKEQYLKSLK